MTEGVICKAIAFWLHFMLPSFVIFLEFTFFTGRHNFPLLRSCDHAVDSATILVGPALVGSCKIRRVFSALPRC